MPLSRRILLFAAAVLPLLFVLDLRDTFDLPKMSLVYVCALALAGLWLQQSFRERAIVWHNTALDIPILLFLLIAFISALGSIDRPLSFWGAYRIYVFGFFPLCAFALLYAWSVQYSDETFVRQLSWVLMGSGALVGLYALLQYSGFEIFERMPKVENGRPWSSLGNPLYAGSICMMSALLSWRHKGPAAWIFFAGSLIGLVLSQSRSAWLGFIAMMALSLWLDRSSLDKKRWFGLVGLVAVLFIAFPQTLQRSKLLLSTRESSNTARVEGWKAAIRIWKERPILGAGPDTFLNSFRKFNSLAYIRSSGRGVSQADAHNDLLQIAATMGTLGVLAYIGMLVFAAKSVRGVLNTPREGLALALAALFVQNQFNFSSVSALAWAALALGAIAKKSGRTQLALPASSRSWMIVPVWAILLLAVHISVVRPVLADYHYQQGMAWTSGGRLEEARRRFLDAVRLQGRIEEYQMAYANRCRDLKYFDEAWATGERLVREHPANPDVWNDQGVIAMWLTQLAGTDRMQVAGAAFQKAVELDPFFVEAWANRARWEHIAGHLDKEKEIWEKVLEMDPNYEMARRVLGR